MFCDGRHEFGSPSRLHYMSGLGLKTEWLLTAADILVSAPLAGYEERGLKPQLRSLFPSDTLPLISTPSALVSICEEARC